MKHVMGRERKKEKHRLDFGEERWWKEKKKKLRSSDLVGEEKRNER
jgi:hypothetical protein